MKNLKQNFRRQAKERCPVIVLGIFIKRCFFVGFSHYYCLLTDKYYFVWFKICGVQKIPLMRRCHVVLSHFLVRHELVAGDILLMKQV